MVGREPERTCVGCRGRSAKGSLLRIGAGPQGPAVDPAGRLPGRGAYVHRDPDCVRLAARKGTMARALRTSLEPVEAARLMREIERNVQK